ncbi:hypothetical protein [Cohnella sp. JJ-181]|uniref:hypothetical protein n=1 Tax=Cohnella rhizoplanae TaxID=2974897 RepID=UPI0022FF8C1E|nr:hypothetical protein [Cohnella sp. JJ-181]CAI6073032.1 hypothetical protein COHCIP112018_02369 [Cohnella sp. JJ-181]
MSNIVEFSAKFTKLTLASKNKIELELPEDINFERVSEILAHKGHTINVVLGNPQMAMNIQQQPNGRSVATINSRGEVEGFTPASEPSDADEVLVQEDQGGDAGDQQEVVFGEDDPNRDPEPEGDENQDPEPDVDPAADVEPAEGMNDEEEPDGEVDPKDLEQFILTERPKFDDIPFDFPKMIELKKAEGLAWHAVPKALGLDISSTKLQQFYGVYKKRCKKKILGAA